MSPSGGSPADPGRAGSPRWELVSGGALGLLAGVALALQIFVNGSLARTASSVPFATLVSFAGGAIILWLLMAQTRRGPEIRVGEEPRPWHYLGGLLGVVVVSVSAWGTSILGVTVVTALVIAGQLCGGLVFDSLRWAPGGRYKVSIPRLAGVLLACTASALMLTLDELLQHAALVAIVFGGGVIGSFATAVNSRLASALGNVWRMSRWNVTIAVGGSAVVLLVSAAVTGGLDVRDISSAQWWEFSGGILGLAWIAGAAVVAKRLGVMRSLMLAVSGQLGASLLLDWLVSGSEVRLTKLVAAVLILVAAMLSSAKSRSSGAGNPRVE